MYLSDHISAHLTYGEAIHSDTAARLNIPNVPDETQLTLMKYVATEIFDKVRDHFNVPIIATSFFRTPLLNNRTPGASKTSQHMKGEAIDHFLAGRNAEMFKWIYENKAILDFDQLIWEYKSPTDPNQPAWVHVSKVSYRPNRRQALRYYLDSHENIVGIPFDLF